MIDTDTRQLRVNAQGQYISGAGKIPCDHCGHAVCKLAPATACSAFMPAIPFVGQVGMDRLFNTIRVGQAWPKRLSQNQVIALYEVREKFIFGHARVLTTIAGPIDEILAHHAKANHLMLETPAEDAQDILHDWLKRNYGPRIITPTSYITAIYLLREPEPAAAPNLGQHEAGRQAQGQPAHDRQDP